MGNENSKLLNMAVKKGIIDITKIKKSLTDMERKEKSENHSKVWKGKNGYWYSYIYEDGKRRLIKKRSKDDIGQAINEHERQIRKDSKKTFEKVYNEWIQYKAKYRELESSTIIRYKSDFQRFFPKGDRFRKMDVNKITDRILEDLIKDIIISEDLTVKSYANLRIIIRGVLRFARRCGYTSYDVSGFFANIDLPRRIFRKKSSRSHYIYTVKERERLYKYLLDNPEIYNLALAFQCLTGLRIGELSTLKIEDNTSNCRLLIRRTETKYDEKGRSRIGVKESAKMGHDGEIILTKEAQVLLDRAYKLSNGAEYIFSIDGERITSRVLTYRLKKACEAIGMEYRSPHKIRKTYGSMLLAARVDDAIVQSQMRHNQISTTREYYHFLTTDSTEEQEILERVLTI